MKNKTRKNQMRIKKNSHGNIIIEKNIIKETAG